MFNVVVHIWYKTCKAMCAMASITINLLEMVSRFMESGPSLFANQQSRLHLRSTHLQLLIRYLGPRYQSVQLHRLCALKPIVMDREKLWGMPTCGCQVTPATCTVRPCLFVKCLKRRDAAGTSFACNWYQPVASMANGPNNKKRSKPTQTDKRTGMKLFEWI